MSDWTTTRTPADWRDDPLTTRRRLYREYAIWPIEEVGVDGARKRIKTMCRIGTRNKSLGLKKLIDYGIKVNGREFEPFRDGHQYFAPDQIDQIAW